MGLDTINRILSQKESMENMKEFGKPLALGKAVHKALEVLANNPNVPVEEAIKQGLIEIERILVTYRDSAIVRGVLSYENGRFTRMLTVANNPKLTVTEEIEYHQGIQILIMILDGKYKLQGFGFILNTAKSVDVKREEVVLA